MNKLKMLELLGALLITITLIIHIVFRSFSEAQVTILILIGAFIGIGSISLRIYKKS